MKQYYRRDLAEIERIVAHTGEFFAQHGIDPALRMRVDLALEELFVNLVTYNTETDKDILVEMQCQPDGIEVSLTDFDVDRFDPTVVAEPDVSSPLTEREPGGLGLFLVSKMVDTIRYQYEDRKSRISFTNLWRMDNA